MAGVVSREAYFETGLDVLSDLGYGGLKLAEVCNRLGVTTGSFYHYFSGWPAYTRELVENWMQERTVLVIEFREERDRPAPPDRQPGSGRPRALRTAPKPRSGRGAAIDPEVYDVQVEVDQQRFDILYDSALEILQHNHQAQMFAPWASICWSATNRPPCRQDTAALAWIAEQLARRTGFGRFAHACASTS